MDAQPDLFDTGACLPLSVNAQASNFGFLFLRVRYSARMNKALPVRFAVVGISLLLGINSAHAHRAGEEMAEAANKFLSSLNTDQTAKATFPVKSDERLNWHFIPKDRNGLPF